MRRSFGAEPLAEPLNPPVREAGLKRPARLVRPGLAGATPSAPRDRQRSGRAARQAVLAHPERERPRPTRTDESRERRERAGGGAARRLRAVEPSPCPTSRCSGSKRAAARGGVSLRNGWTPTGRRRSGRTGSSPSASATTSVRGSGHQSATSCQRFDALDLDRPRTASPAAMPGTTSEGTPSRSAIAAASRSWRSRSWRTPGGLAERRAPGRSPRASRPDRRARRPVGRDERVRRPRHRLSTIHENPCGRGRRRSGSPSRRA